MTTKVEKLKQSRSLAQFHEETRIRAGEISTKRIEENRPADDLSNWLEAEKEIKLKYKLQ